MPVSEQHIPKEAADALFAVLVTRGSARAAIAAALNAWPEIHHSKYLEGKPIVILPLGEQS